MKAIDAIKQAARNSGVNTTEIGPAIGKTKAYLASNAYRGSTPKADNVAAMLEACGYVLCAVPKDKVPKSAIVIDPSR